MQLTGRVAEAASWHLTASLAYVMELQIPSRLLVHHLRNLLAPLTRELRRVLACLP